MEEYSIRKLKKLADSLISYPEKYSEKKTPLLDMQCFLQSVLKCTKTYLFSHDDYILTEKEKSEIFKMFEKRKTGLPVAYITGHKEFYNLDFYVNPHVLIPKPDTELLVEKALEYIKENNFTNILDLCTGSGCIAVSVLKNLNNKIIMTASDISENALKVAQINSRQLLTEEENKRIRFIHADLFTPLSESVFFSENYDMIISNPPYVPKDITSQLLLDGRNEPRLALDGDYKCNTSDGTGLIAKLIPESFNRLKKGGMLLLECGEYNADKTEELLKKNAFSDTKIFYDLSGLKRVVTGLKI